MDAQGHATDDPNALFTDPPGTLQPTGGRDHGHKGYGLALTVEALTQALPGFGRASKPSGWGAGVFIQVFDPQAFGGAQPFAREMDWLAEACRNNPPRPIRRRTTAGPAGDGAEGEALANGVRSIPASAALQPWAGS
jgi:LDH2 family malate/lactate/ureidoglycolate dehydrogenase